jgi:membrane protease YdiL (CAAX protease family)
MVSDCGYVDHTAGHGGAGQQRILFFIRMHWRVIDVSGHFAFCGHPRRVHDILITVPEVPRVQTRDSCEIAIGYALILLVVWTPNPIARVLFWIALAWFAVSTFIPRPRYSHLGLALSWKRADVVRSLLLVSSALVLAGIGIFSAIRMHTLHGLYGSSPVRSHVWGYVVWSFMQQFILQGYFMVRLLRIVPNQTKAILLAAVMFSSAHLPNPLLTVATLVWGAAACALFLRYRNLYSLGAIHAVLGLCIAFTVPNAIHHHMRVGLGYLRYHHEFPVAQPANNTKAQGT